MALLHRTTIFHASVPATGSGRTVQHSSLSQNSARFTLTGAEPRDAPIPRGRHAVPTIGYAAPQ
jgi:hypothetical protein